MSGTYQIVFKHKFATMDDIAAREATQEWMKKAGITDRSNIRLHRLQKNAPPVGVQIFLEDK